MAKLQLLIKTNISTNSKEALVFCPDSVYFYKQFKKGIYCIVFIRDLEFVIRFCIKDVAKSWGGIPKAL